MTGVGDKDRMGAIQAQRLYGDAALRYAPAVAAGAIALSHVSPASAFFVFLAVLFAASVLLPRRHPMHLTPLSAVATRAVVPAAGVTAAYALSAALAPLDPMALFPALVGAWIVIAFLTWISSRMESGLEARVAVIGPSEVAASLKRELAFTATRGYRVVGFIGDGSGALGSLDELAAIVRDGRIDLLVDGGQDPRAVERVADACLAFEVRMITANQLFEELFGHVPIATLNSAFFQYLMHPRYSGGSPVMKRLVDVAVSASALVVLAPVLALVALAVKLGDGGPVLFRQVRVGRGGKPFRILKLRTMRVDAERDGSRWAAADDDRITASGRALRRTHVDELPQLWNVLRGEMTLVGPRPEVPDMVADLEWMIPFYDRRELVKPGITGWAQVRCGYAGSGAGTAWKLCHDLYYLKHRSLGLDLMIIFETLATVGSVQFGVRSPDERFVLDAIQADADGLALETSVSA